MKRKLFWIIVSVLASLLVSRLAFGQTYTFPRSTQSVTFYWTHDDTAHCRFALYFHGGVIRDEIRGLQTTVTHSTLGDSVVAWATAYPVGYPSIESGPSNLVTVLFKDAVISPVVTYLPMPYAAGTAQLHNRAEWNDEGSAVIYLRADEIVLYGPNMGMRVPGSIKLTASIETAGSYRIRVHTWADNVIINGYTLKMSDKDWEWAEHTVPFVNGLNAVTLSNSLVWARIDSVRIEPVHMPDPPSGPVGLGVR